MFVCLFVNFSNSLHSIDAEFTKCPQSHPGYILRGLAFRFRPSFNNFKQPILFAILQMLHFNVLLWILHPVAMVSSKVQIHVHVKVIT